MNPTATSAQSKSPSHARVMPPSPIAVRSWLTVPDFASTQFHMIPAATSGMIWGRNSTVRDTVPKRPRAAPRMNEAVTRPTDDRDEAEEDDELEGVEDRVEQLLVAEHLRVVVEADPGRHPDAVPVVERVLEAQDERLEDEHRVEREGGHDEQPAQEMIAANPPEEPGGSPRRWPGRAGAGHQRRPSDPASESRGTTARSSSVPGRP